MKIIKKTLAPSIILFVAVLIAAYVVAGNFYKNELYHAAVGFEANLSGLSFKTMQLADGEVHYLENDQAGHKPTVLLVHGFAAYKENWLRFARPFQSDFHVIALDLPGHGRSFNHQSLTYSLSNQVGWIHEFMQKLGVQQFHIAGNSMGGAISSLYSATYPEQILSTTLLNPSGPKGHRPVFMDYIDRGENPLVVNNAEEFDFLMDFAMEQRPFVPWPLTEVLAERASKMAPLHHKLRQDTLAERGDGFEPVLTQIKAPTLILWGKQDRICHYKNAEIFDRLIANSRVHIWDNVGHVPMIEIPKQSALMMIDHIRTTGTELATAQSSLSN